LPFPISASLTFINKLPFIFRYFFPVTVSLYETSMVSSLLKMQAPNPTARVLFSGMVPKPKKPVQEQVLIQMNLLPSIDALPRNHPASEVPNIATLPQNIQKIIQNLNIDFQARKLTLRNMFQMLLAVKFDYVQLHAGFEPVVPANPNTDKTLKNYCEFSLTVADTFLQVLIQGYIQLYELTQEVLTVTPEQWIAHEQVAEPADDSEESQ
jgi:hypothetical protein